MMKSIETIYEEEKIFSIESDTVKATITAIVADKYLIIDRQSKAGKWSTTSFEPHWMHRKSWALDDELTVERALGFTPAEQLRYVIAQADKWFEKVDIEVGKWMPE